MSTFDGRRGRSSHYKGAHGPSDLHRTADQSVKRRLTKYEKAQLIDALRAGQPALELAEQLGISYETVRYYAKYI